jgi:hypothetical protein
VDPNHKADRVTLQSDPIYYEFSRFASRPRKLEKRGVRFGIDFILEERSKPYANAEFFSRSYSHRVTSQSQGTASLEEFGDEDAVVLMDNCPSHVMDEVLGLLRYARVRVLTWAPHATQIF